MTIEMTVLSNTDATTGCGHPPTANSEVGKHVPQGTVANDLQKRGVREECLDVKRRDYPEEDGKQWYVLRATYNRERRAYRYFHRHGITAYLPMHSYWEKHDGYRQKVTKSLLPCLVFVYEKQEEVHRLVKDTPALTYLRFYYNKVSSRTDGLDKKLTIPYDEMLNFIVVTSVKNPYTRVVNRSHCRFKSGDIVVVKRGDFKGVVGRVARVNGQTCVVVELQGVCLVATAYVGKDDLEAFNEA